jgi:hypothetical protein
MARMMSVDLSMTITAAVPRPDFSSRSVSKSIGSVADRSAGRQRHRRAAGDHREQIVPAAAHAAAMRSISSRKGMPISSSTVHGLFTWPEMQKSLVPVLFGRPSPANQAAPRRRIVGATAIDSTLLTVVGQP